MPGRVIGSGRGDEGKAGLLREVVDLDSRPDVAGRRRSDQGHVSRDQLGLGQHGVGPLVGANQAAISGRHIDSQSRWARCRRFPSWPRFPGRQNRTWTELAGQRPGSPLPCRGTQHRPYGSHRTYGPAGRRTDKSSSGSGWEPRCAGVKSCGSNSRAKNPGGRPSGRKRKTISLPADLARRLAAFAAWHGRTEQDVVAEALQPIVGGFYGAQQADRGEPPMILPVAPTAA